MNDKEKIAALEARIRKLEEHIYHMEGRQYSPGYWVESGPNTPPRRYFTSP